MAVDFTSQTARTEGTKGLDKDATVAKRNEIRHLEFKPL